MYQEQVQMVKIRPKSKLGHFNKTNQSNSFGIIYLTLSIANANKKLISCGVSSTDF